MRVQGLDLIVVLTPGFVSLRESEYGVDPASVWIPTIVFEFVSTLALSALWMRITRQAIVFAFGLTITIALEIVLQPRMVRSVVRTSQFAPMPMKRFAMAMVVSFPLVFGTIRRLKDTPPLLRELAFVSVCARPTQRRQTPPWILVAAPDQFRYPPPRKKRRIQIPLGQNRLCF
jgi:hypothetical protein